MGMSTSTYAVFIGDDRWQAMAFDGKVIKTGAIDFDSGRELSEHIAQVKAALKSLGWRSHDICLGLPSNQVLTASIECGSLPKKNRHQAMVYKLEESLPVDAEMLTVDFIRTEGDIATGVAVRTDKAAAIISEFQRQGIEIGAMVPTALLAVWQLLRTRTHPVCYYVIATGGWADVFRTRMDDIYTWQTCQNDSASIIRCIEADMLLNPSEGVAPAAVVAGDIDVHTTGDIERVLSAKAEVVPASKYELAYKASADAIGGTGAGWVNLRRDSLAVSNPWSKLAGLIKLAVVVAMLIPLTLAAMFFLRSEKYQANVEESRQQIADLYRQYKNEKAVPAGAVKILDKELKMCRGLAGADKSLVIPQNALVPLRSVIASLPAEVKVQIAEIQVDQNSIFLTGDVVSHADAEKIANAIRAAGFTVENPPTRRQTDGTTYFSLKAFLPKPASPTPAKKRGGE